MEFLQNKASQILSRSNTSNEVKSFLQNYADGNFEQALKVMPAGKSMAELAPFKIDTFHRLGLSQLFIEELANSLVTAKEPIQKFEEEILDEAKNHVAKAFWTTSLKSQVDKLPSGAIADLLKNSKNFSVPAEVTKAHTLYKNKDYQAAAVILKKIDPSSSYYLQTREELAWSFLRAGDYSSLSGLVVHLKEPFLPAPVSLEARVIRAISYLNACEYESVKQEIKSYQTEMQDFLKNQIDVKPEFFKKTITGIPGLDKTLANESTLQAQLQIAKKIEAPAFVTASYEKNLGLVQTLWLEKVSKYQKSILAQFNESMLKMKVLRIEFLSQLKQLEKNNKNVDEVEAERLATLPSTKKNEQMFRVNPDDVWADEIFQAKGTASTFCLNLKR